MRIGLLCLIFVSHLALAADVDPLKNLLCVNEVKKTLQTWSSLNDWHHYPSFDPDTLVNRSPTKNIGEWVELRSWQNNPELIYLGLKKTETVTFSTPKCLKKIVTTPQIQAPTPEATNLSYFTDAMLKDLVDSGKPGIIFMWSPYMEISVLALNEAKIASERLHLMFIPMIVREQEAVSAIAKAKEVNFAAKDIYIQNAKELTFRSLDTHFPSLLFFANHQILSRVYRGYEDADVYAKYFSDYLKTPKIN